MAVQALPSSRRTSPPLWFGSEGAVMPAPGADASLLFLAHLLDIPVHAPLPPPRRSRTVSPLPEWRLRRVVAYIEANIAEPISLADLAAAAGMSRMYFASQFRAATGLRPHEYVLRKRIERAQDLLSCSAGALVEIALSVGFQTQAHFTTVFKKVVGVTPRRWRRQPRPLHEEWPSGVPVKTMREPVFA